jgi:hypothetical protein
MDMFSSSCGLSCYIHVAEQDEMLAFTILPEIGAVKEVL